MSTTNNLTKVALSGVSGDVGRPVLTTLLREPPMFDVTILIRKNSLFQTPAGARVIRLDFQDTAALVEALRGHDVVLSTLGNAAQSEKIEVALLEAAIAAGVPRFISSDFTLDTTHPTIVSYPPFAYKVDFHKLLEKYKNQISYSYVINGAFLDWGLKNGFLGFDLIKKTATIFDEGKHRVSGATLKTIAEGVRGLLLHPNETRNRAVKVADATFTQIEVLALLEKYTGTKWTVTHKTTVQAKKEGFEAWDRGDFGPATQFLILSIAYGGGGAAILEENDNVLLGVTPVSLEKIIKDVV